MILDEMSVGGSVEIVIVDHDPRVTATDAEKGSMIIYENNNEDIWFSKRDAGLSTNVEHVMLHNNHTATTNPTVNDDITEGYDVGSSWLNTSTNTFFKLAVKTTGAAVWV